MEPHTAFKYGRHKLYPETDLSQHDSMSAADPCGHSAYRNTVAHGKKNRKGEATRHERWEVECSRDSGSEKSHRNHHKFTQTKSDMDSNGLFCVVTEGTPQRIALESVRFFPSFPPEHKGGERGFDAEL
jgi:hypothetical protein